MVQFFFVKSGILSIETEYEIISLAPGEGVELKDSAKHRVHNSGETAAEYVVAERYGDDCSTYYD
jgi:mannose-6-phosphate isomerase-like protein (cupin superfamily)